MNGERLSPLFRRMTARDINIDCCLKRSASKFFFSLLLILLTVGLLSLTGCVRIPKQHFTVGQNGQRCVVSTDCLCEDSVLPAPYLSDPDQQNGLDPQRFTLLNWNGHKETGIAWLEDLARLTMDVDLLTMQEVMLTANLQNFLKTDFSDWTLANAFTRSDLPVGVLTGSTVQPDFSCSFRVAEPLINVPKTAVVTRYPFAGSDQTLLLANLHMVNFSLAVVKFTWQLQKIFDLIDQHPGPVLLVGDFNSWSVKRFTILQRFTEAAGIRPVRFAADNRKTFFGLALDHIFYRGLEPLDEVVEQVTTSDHNPMRVAFRLNNQQAGSMSDE